MYSLCHSIQKCLKKKKRKQPICMQVGTEATEFYKTMKVSKPLLFPATCMNLRIVCWTKKYTETRFRSSPQMGKLGKGQNGGSFESYSFHFFPSHCVSVGLHVYAHTCISENYVYIIIKYWHMCTIHFESIWFIKCPVFAHNYILYTSFEAFENLKTPLSSNLDINPSKLCQYVL